MPANNQFDPLDFGGCDPCNVLAAYDAARQAQGALVFAPGFPYKVDRPLLLDWYGATAGCVVPHTKAKLTYTAKDGDVFRLQGNTGILEHLCVHDLLIDSSDDVAPYRTGCGIKQLGLLGQSAIKNVKVRRQYFGIQLDSTDFSVIENIISQENISHGVLLYASRPYALQWYWSGQNLSQLNGGDGLRVAIDPVNGVGAGVMSTGTINNFCTYANKGHAAGFYGFPNCGIASIRWNGGFVGGELDDEIYLDTYGSDHHFSNIYGEMSLKRGFYATANNKHVTLTDVTMVQMGLAGFVLMGDDARATNCTALSNGAPINPQTQQLDANTPSPTPWGFYLGGKRAQIVGGRSGNGSVQWQKFGVVNGNPVVNGVQDKPQIIGHNAVGNLTAGYDGPFQFGNL